MQLSGKAHKLKLFDFKTTPMRAFHMTWMAFFLCFFGWFGVAPLMGVIRQDLNLTKDQIGNIIIASVSITIFARLAVGWFCDKFGPRLSYTLLLVFGSLPVMGIGLSTDYTSFLLFRLAIGVIGASFVITQYHTSLMFSSKCVGTANATSAGWGNLGGGVTQMVMPLFLSMFMLFGFSAEKSWRLSMILPGMALLVMGVLYWKHTKDTPEGNFSEISRASSKKGTFKEFLNALSDKRVWALFVIYGACFGIELTINNIAVLYFIDNFSMDIKTAGIVAGLFGLMNIFARTLGGLVGDRFGVKHGLKGRVKFLGMIIFLEGIALVVFSKLTILPLAILGLIVFSLCVQMSEGATFSVVPFINRRAVGSVSGIVGAGGNVGAVLAGFLFKSAGITWPEALTILGVVVTLSSLTTLFITFSAQDEATARSELEQLTQETEELAA